MKKRENQQKLVRLLALVLVILMAGTTVLAALMGALAEEAEPVRDAYELNIEYLNDEQALHITQRLVYHNRTEYSLDRVIFYAAGNMFRRESALMYEADVIESVFPDGYAPAGIDLQSVLVDGQKADWGYQDKEEMNLRVACSLAPGESCTFEFDYYLLLSRSCAMIGEYDTDVRLSGFYFIPALNFGGEFFSYSPLQFTRWISTNAADYSVTLSLPDQYLPAATGSETLLSTENHRSIWQFEAQNVREFALSFGRRYRETSVQTQSGVTIRALSNHRSGAAHALKYAAQIIEIYESWLGDFPVSQIDLVQTDYPVDSLNFPGSVWIPNEMWNDKAALEQALRFCLAQQYIGYAAYAEPVSDAWLSDVPCAYLSLLAVEELKGYDAFLSALNDQVLPALNMTIPGSLYITAAANLFTAEEYAIIVRDRGTVVMHEMRVAMGRESFIAGLRRFYEMGLATNLLGEYDFVSAFDQVTGGDWEDFITEWLFNVDDYLSQEIEFYE